MMECDFHDDSGCRLGLHDGSPTKDDCDRCPRYAGRPRGLGDVVHGAIVSTGVERVVKAIIREPCGGCHKRRVRLNTVLPRIK